MFSWFRNLRINAKLTLGFGMVLAVALMIGAVGLYNATQTARDVERLHESNTAGAAQLADAQSALWQLRWDVAQFIALKDAAERQKLADNSTVQQRIVEQKLKEFEASKRSSDELKVLGQLRHSFTQYVEARPKWFQLYADGRLEEAAQWRAQTITAFGAETVANFARLIELQRKNGAAVQRDVVGRINTFITALVVLLVAVVVSGLITGHFMGQAITGPISDAVAATRQIANGDLAVQIRDPSRDEPGQLLAALAHMRDSLAGAVDTIRRSAENVGTASRQIANGNVEMSTRTEEQASSLEETASSMEELTATVRHSAESAKQANDLAVGASGVAAQGAAAMEEVASTMGGISDGSKRIADIIGVIDGIAFQTNILALNASVEAARAGEQGRGFAVVATEVRNLAQRTSDAAREIKDLIQNSVERVGDGTRKVQDLGTAMDKILTAVKQVTDLMTDMATAVRQQLSGIEQVAKAVAQMDRMTQENASFVEQTAAAAEHAAQQAAQLLESVAQFRLPEVHQLEAVPERTAVVRSFDPMRVGAAAD